MNQIQTKFFGKLTCAPDSLFAFPFGLPGFEEQRAFVFLSIPELEPLLFLQSASTSSLCFILLPILVVDPTYNLDFTAEELSELELATNRPPVIGEDILCAALVSTGPEGTSSVNLMAPVVVNLKTKTGMQVIRGESGYSHRHPLFFEEPVLSC